MWRLAVAFLMLLPACRPPQLRPDELTVKTTAEDGSRVVLAEAGQPIGIKIQILGPLHKRVDEAIILALFIDDNLVLTSEVFFYAEDYPAREFLVKGSISPQAWIEKSIIARQESIMPDLDSSVDFKADARLFLIIGEQSTKQLKTNSPPLTIRLSCARCIG